MLGTFNLGHFSFIIVLVFVSQTCVFAQNTISIDSLTHKELVKNEPYFTIFGDNYFTTGIPTNREVSSLTSDVKFEIGFKQRLTNLVLPFKSYAYITYRQKSFWDVYQESSPFTETNYNPGIGFARPFFKNNQLKKGIFLQFEHQSNGREGEFSRSWNFMSLSFLYMHQENWQFGIKAWAPIGPLKDNPDLTDYIGFQETSIAFMPNPRLMIEANIRKAFSWDLKGSLKMAISYKLDRDANQYLYLQYYLGYAESLIEYNENVSMIRLGIVFKDLFGNFKRYAE